MIDVLIADSVQGNPKLGFLYSSDCSFHSALPWVKSYLETEKDLSDLNDSDNECKLRLVNFFRFLNGLRPVSAFVRNNSPLSEIHCYSESALGLDVQGLS